MQMKKMLMAIPPKELLEHDKELAPYNYQVIDKK